MFNLLSDLLIKLNDNQVYTNALVGQGDRRFGTPASQKKIHILANVRILSFRSVPYLEGLDDTDNICSTSHNLVRAFFDNKLSSLCNFSKEKRKFY